MKIVRLKSIRLFLGAFLLVTAMAGQVLAEDANPVGNWNFILSESQVQGMCPMGGDGTGTLTIKDMGEDGLAITYLQGMTCDPPEVCELPGFCSGNECVFSTTVEVDDEGGEVTNTAELQVIAPHHMEGTGSSVYKHPSGFTCTWTYLLTLTRPAD